MPEQIIYRGFCEVQNGKTKIKIGDQIKIGYWIEGAYMQHENRQVSPMGNQLKPEDIDHLILYSGSADWNMPRQVCVANVLPETVCRCAYKSTKFGLLFEHDVVKYRKMNLMGSSTDAIGEIVIDSHGAYIQPIGKKRTNCEDRLISDMMIIEKIGNLFEINADEVPQNPDQIVMARIESSNFDISRGLTHNVDLVTESGKYLSFGGYHLGGDFCYRWIAAFMEVIGLDRIEFDQISGKHVRVKIDGDRVVAIGHTVRDVWLDVREIFQAGGKHGGTK